MNRDFSDMLSALSAAGADYLVVGAHAVGVHAEPRATGDLDVWVRIDDANADRVLTALRTFGAPLFDLCKVDLLTPGTVFQIGLPPARIDLLTQISGVTFEEAWTRRVAVPIEGLTVPVIGRDDLIANKRASGRPKDLADLLMLERGAEE